MTAVELDRPALDGENFPVAMRLIPERYRDHLWALYRYARFVDDLGDEAEGDRRLLLTEVDNQVCSLFDEQPVDHPQTVREPAVAGLAATVRKCRLPIEPLRALIRANLQDQEVARYETFEELLGYCRLSADPVGELVLHVFDAATPDRIALSNRICTGLQLLEHLQDVAEDYRAGRIYLPTQDLCRYGVSVTDLGAPSANPALRALIGFETDRALAWLDAGAVLTATLRGWARLSVSGYIAGGRAAAQRLRAGGYDPLPAPPKPTARHVAQNWLTATLRRPG